MKLQTHLRKVAAVAAIASSFLASAQTSGSERISACLREARLHAWLAAEYLAQVQTYSKAGVPWQVHVDRLRKTQDEVMALGKDTEELMALSDAATDDQFLAMDQIEHFTQILSASVNESLRYISSQPAAVNLPPFTQLVNSAHATATKILSILDRCVTASSTDSPNSR
jgi:hypothetical protein